MTRYEANGSEAESEPGSDGEVLANLVGITDPVEMNDAVMELLEDLYEPMSAMVRESLGG